jgi:hypothetical protein
MERKRDGENLRKVGGRGRKSNGGAEKRKGGGKIKGGMDTVTFAQTLCLDGKDSERVLFEM